ncbi:heavy metal-binding domain-containing protein [Vibrio harveyi]|nr:heavy metal-binding domain-containing protein [Vibrio harveyi]
MIYSTTETIPGREIAEIKGVVTGNVVQSKHIGRDFMAGLKSIVGIRFTTSSIVDGSSEILAFGTAVKLV